MSTATNQEKKFTPKEVGNYIFPHDEIPKEIITHAEARLGEKTNVNPARFNGDYKGTVILNSDKYIVQAVGNREQSAVVHLKKDIELVSDNLKWRDQNNRMGSTDVAIHYNEDKARVYPWNRQIELDNMEKNKTMKMAREFVEKNPGEFKSKKDIDTYLKRVEMSTTQHLEKRTEARKEKEAATREAAKANREVKQEKSKER